MTFRSDGVASRGCRSTLTLTVRRPLPRAAPPTTRRSRDAGAHPLAAHVDFGRAVVDRRDDAFEAEAADDRRDRRRAGARRVVDGRRRRRRRRGSSERCDDRVDRGARVAARRAGVAGRDARWRAASCAMRVGLRLQVRDDVVDLAARLAHLRRRAPRSAAAGTSPRAARSASSRCAHPRARPPRASRARARPAGARARARAGRGRSSRGARRAALRARSGSAAPRRRPTGSGRAAPAISSARLRPGDP